MPIGRPVHQVAKASKPKRTTDSTLKELRAFRTTGQSLAPILGFKSV